MLLKDQIITSLVKQHNRLCDKIHNPKQPATFKALMDVTQPVRDLRDLFKISEDDWEEFFIDYIIDSEFNKTNFLE